LERRRTESSKGNPILADLMIRGGRVFDPAQRALGQQDIAIAKGRIVRIGDLADVVEASRVLDAAGMIVTPGLIDLHVHAFPLGQLIGVDVDPLSSRSGVTTFIDAGSTGALNFLAFRRYVVERARSNLFALLNVSAIGCCLHGLKGVEMWEGEIPALISLPAAIELIEGNRDIIIGVKVRLNTGLPTLAPLAAARELADTVSLPLVVHAVSPPPSFRDVLPYLRPGDVVTHIYHSGPGAIVNRSGRLCPEYQEARARGVLMDTGSAWMFTDFAVARVAIQQGFVPDTISSDLTTLTLDRLTVDLPTTLSKFMALGLGLEDVLVKATAAPARFLPAGRGFGQLKEGAPADLAILALEEGEFEYRDKFGHQAGARKRLVSFTTVKDGQILEPSPNEVLPWKFLWRW